MNVAAHDLELGDVIVTESQSGIITDLRIADRHVRVTFADGQARSYDRDRPLKLTCARLAACPRGFCDARDCSCKPCHCRVCEHRRAHANAAYERVTEHRPGPVR